MEWSKLATNKTLLLVSSDSYRAVFVAILLTHADLYNPTSALKEKPTWSISVRWSQLSLLLGVVLIMLESPVLHVTCDCEGRRIWFTSFSHSANLKCPLVSCGWGGLSSYRGIKVFHHRIKITRVLICSDPFLQDDKRTKTIPIN